MKNKYEVRGDVTVIYIEKDGVQYEALIDVEDFEKVKGAGKLRILMGGRKNGGKRIPYIAAGKGLHSPLLHRYLTLAPKGSVVDHINHNTLDNRKVNLRVVTQKENQFNQIVKPREYIGTMWLENENGKVETKLIVNGRAIPFGEYDTSIEAAKVAYEARRPYLEGVS